MSNHRGLAPGDEILFSLEKLPLLRTAVSDLSWLFSRDYPEVASLKLVGDHANLIMRQRSAIMRSACAEQSLRQRSTTKASKEKLRGHEIWLDGFNLLTTLEVALSGGVVLRGRDHCFRDIAGVHGTYRKVEETLPALVLIGDFIQSLSPSRCVWLLDNPVSNSGRLQSIILETAQERRWDFEVQLVPDPDPILIQSKEIIASADSAILDRCTQWFNLNDHLIPSQTPHAWLVDLSEP
jgi:hypothetical protein